MKNKGWIMSLDGEYGLDNESGWIIRVGLGIRMEDKDWIRDQDGG